MQHCFSGRKNLESLLAALTKDQGLGHADEVVINGGSAGAMAVYLHADRIRASLPAAARVVALPDDGFFMDNSFSEGNGWAEHQRWVYTQQNSTAGTPAACRARYPAAQQWKCFFSQYVAPTMTTPVFALQPRYDAYQIGAEIASKTPANVNAYGANLTATLVAALLPLAPEPSDSPSRARGTGQKNGAFIDACEHHGGGWEGLYAGGASPWDAFTTWYTGKAGAPAQNLWLNTSTFPCKDCCGHCTCCVCHNGARMASITGRPLP